MTTPRRQFLKQSGLMAAGLMSAPLWSMGKPLAPSDTVRVALIGARNMGFFNLENCLQVDGVVCPAICDVDQHVLTEKQAQVEQMTGTRPKGYGDFRKVLEDPEVDAVIIGTPDHWHCLMAIMACEAGKAVYVEKPMANSIAEAEAMVRAVRRTNAVLQVGQQQRSGPHWQEAVAYVQSGKLGKIRQVKVWGNFEYGRGNPTVPNEPVPTHLDYDMWLGPAPVRPYNPNRLHGAWRHTWDFGGGLVTDWGVHLLDVVMWAMGSRMPERVSAMGGIYQYQDRMIETPDTLDVTWDMGDYTLQWSHFAGEQPGMFGRNYGIAFLGNDGTLVINRGGWEVLGEAGQLPEHQQSLKPFVEGITSNHLAHAQNFIAAIREGAAVNCPVEAGRDAAAIAQLGTLALRTGLTLQPAGNLDRLSGMPELQGLYQPEYRKPWAFPSL